MAGLKRIRRDPLRFEVFAAYAGAHGKVALGDPAGIDDFVGNARASIRASLAQPTFIHGQRTQAMFEAVTVELGRVRMVRAEDSGGGWCDVDNIEIPDYRLVLDDGSQLLVEVKNFRLATISGLPSYTFKRFSYLEGLAHYGSFVQTPVMIAIFWSNLGLWTLNRLSDVEQRGARGVITFEKAMKTSEMAMLGDYMVGTRFPLQLKLYADHAAERNVQPIDNGAEARLTIGSFRWWCAGTEITDERERSLAFYLMSLGKWNEESYVEMDEAGLPEAIVFEATPDDDVGGFGMLGFISEMSSRHFLLSTQNESGVARLHSRPSPGFWASLMPGKDYKSEALPLWRFIPQPNRDAPFAPPTVPP